jgi:hypothetical protein
MRSRISLRAASSLEPNQVSKDFFVSSSQASRSLIRLSSAATAFFCAF